MSGIIYTNDLNHSLASNNLSYSGDILSEIRHGLGTLQSENFHFKGTFRQGQPHGTGIAVREYYLKVCSYEMREVFCCRAEWVDGKLDQDICAEYCIFNIGFSEF